MGAVRRRCGHPDRAGTRRACHGGGARPRDRRRIASGEWPPGHKLPSTKALAEMYEVGSQSTVRQAITILIETGELYGHQGLGVFVADRADR
ncbi:GntR family transcriptional regulator [Micromonospora sp. WMMD754]|uniref:GntR family transcriptional regulator n=1 Tax=Micromonospora sp. WMMD754 TaxID=3404114 RepID=UPI003BF5D435